MLRTKTINDFLTVLASNAPTPGGGSVAALNGALGAALLEMVCDLTIGKEKYKEVWPDLEPIRTELENLREELTESIDRDALAYDKVTAAFSLPKSTPEEKSTRKDAIQEAMKSAAALPEETAKLIHKCLKHAVDVSQKGNPNVASDAGVAAECLLAGLNSALMNIAINLGSIKDEQYVEQMKTEMKFLEDECTRLAKAVASHVRKAIGMEE